MPSPRHLLFFLPHLSVLQWWLMLALLLLLLPAGDWCLCGEHACRHLPAHRAAAAPGWRSSRVRGREDVLQCQVSIRCWTVALANFLP
jgi:hypothetical protein